MEANPYLEDIDSQIPAIELLVALGWSYLSPEESLSLRDGRLDRPVLDGVLRPWLAERNRFMARGGEHRFSEKSINEAVRRLLEEPFDGLVRTNERVYLLLTLGTSLDETVAGDTRGRTLHYVDWRRPERNLYHVTEEFVVERHNSHHTRRPDLVLFVNGIPFAVIECKRRDGDGCEDRQVERAVAQLRTYQKKGEIPHLFQYAQLLLATSVNEVLYATVDTPRRFWSIWSEERLDEAALREAANRPLPAERLETLLTVREGDQGRAYAESLREHLEALREGGARIPTEQDRVLWSLLRPSRLLDLSYGYVVFDAGVRKIARHQQYFAIQETLARVEPLRDGTRRGGVVWHTTGSGKSLTMVMLAKALALSERIDNARVVLVTDRVDLDEQLWRTFEACGKPAVRAKDGEELVRLVEEGSAGVITTVIHKFDKVINKRGVRDSNPNLFVLVDEGHRSNYNKFHADMRRVFTHGCFIAFTGTPLTKEEKSTADKFGGFIHDYTMRRAVEEKAVLPLSYEGRIAELEQNKAAMDAWFERLTRGLGKEQRVDLKRKMARKEVVQKARQRLMMIAYDIGEHYRKNFQGTGLKGQLAADSRASAILYRQFFEEFGVLRSEVVMSSPDGRDTGVDAADRDEDKPMIARFWAEMMERFGSEEAYNREIKASFGRDDGVEILIVVDKLLTGFDEPRNTVLYVDRGLKEHAILQAIARVNRLFNDDKERGLVIDYRGVLGDLDKAVKTYDKLAQFDPEDVEMVGVIADVDDELAKLPQYHGDLWAVFKEVENRRDREALEVFLAEPDRRHAFYEALVRFQNGLALAFATERFWESSEPKRIERYKEDLKLFRSLRTSVQQRYAEAVDFTKYEKQIRKVMDSHIQAPEVVVVSDLVDIFDVKAFDEEVERREGKAAKADTIASRVKKTATERMDEDPAFYRKFADMIQQVIDDYRQGRIDEAEYLRRAEEGLATLRAGREAGLPSSLEGHREATAYFGLLRDLLAGRGRTAANGEGDGGGKKVAEPPAPYHTNRSDERFARFSLRIEALIDERKVRDWPHREDVLHEMAHAIDDYLFDLRDREGLPVTTEDMDYLIERCLAVAKKHAAS